MAAWWGDRLGRSLQDLVGFLGELHGKGIDLYLHQQGIDTTTPVRANNFPPAARHAAREVRQARADERAAKQAAGVTSLNGIAEALNARGVVTPTDAGRNPAGDPSRLGRGPFWTTRLTDFDGAPRIACVRGRNREVLRPHV